VELIGDWNKLDRFLKEIVCPSNLIKIKRKALMKALAFLERKIKENIHTEGRLTGKPFKKLAEATQIYKEKAGKTKILTFSADMIANVKAMMFDQDFGFVGIKRGVTHISNAQVVDIAEAHEFGVILGSKVYLPKRPFIKPVLDKFKDEAYQIYCNVVKEELAL